MSYRRVNPKLTFIMLKTKQIRVYLQYWSVSTRLLLSLIPISFLIGLWDLDTSFPSFPWSAHAISRNGCRKKDPATFAEKVIAIDCKIGDWMFQHSLFQAKDFIAIYQYPQYYHAHIWSVLHSCWFSQRQKTIVVYAMSRLPLTDYILFLEKSHQLYQMGYLEADVLRIVLGDKPITHRHPIVTNMQDPRIARILLQIQRDNDPKMVHVVDDLKHTRVHCHDIFPIEIAKDFYLPPVSLKETIEDIVDKEQKKQKCTDPSMSNTSLLSYSDFIEIYTHPDCYLEEAIACIKETTFTRFHYYILCSAMTNLKAENYARLVEAFCSAYLKGNISACVLILCNAGDDSYHRKHFICNYKHPVLQYILKKITTNENLPVKFKLSIANVKSGKEKMMRAHHKEMYKPFFFHEDIAARWYADHVVILLLVFIFCCYKWMKYLLKSTINQSTIK